MNTAVTSKIITDEIYEISPVDYGTEQDKLQQLRMLNDSVRYHLDGKLRIVALMLNEMLPKRMDYRNTPRPAMNPENTGLEIMPHESLLHYLATESVDYISYLVRMSPTAMTTLPSCPSMTTRTCSRTWNLFVPCGNWILPSTRAKCFTVVCWRKSTSRVYLSSWRTLRMRRRWCCGKSFPWYMLSLGTVELAKVRSTSL